MKVSFTLKPDQKLILQILLEAGNISFAVLREVVEAIDNIGLGIKSIVKTVIDKNDTSLPPFGVNRLKDKEIERTIDGLVFIGLINSTNSGGFSNSNSLPAFTSIWLTTEGKRIAKSIKDKRHYILRPAPEQRMTIFVACAFGYNEIDLLYDNHLLPACKLLQYEPIRIDNTEPTQSIADAIIKGISECACVIADLTFARPSVYFEVGLAHGLGIPLLLTCRSDHHRGKSDNLKVHFDLEQYKISFWNRTPKGHFRWKNNMKPSTRLPLLVPKRK